MEYESINFMRSFSHTPKRMELLQENWSRTGEISTQRLKISSEASKILLPWKYKRRFAKSGRYRLNRATKLSSYIKCFMHV
jgi:hypothetical protein